MRNLIIPACLALVTLATDVRCAPPGHVKGSGPVIKRALTVQPFHGVVLEGSMDVRLTKSDARSVEVEAQENIIAIITTEVKDGVWHIGTSENYSTDKPFIVYISLPAVDRVSIEGSGDVTGQGEFSAEKMVLSIAGSGSISLSFAAERTHASIAGSGDMSLKGRSGTLEASIAGSGDVDAEELAVGDLDAEISGSGDVEVDASGQVDASIAGSGDVVLSRKPANIKQNVAGSGSVRVEAR